MKIAFVIINANRREGSSRAVMEVAERLSLSHEVDIWSRTYEGSCNSRVKWIRIPGPRRPEVVDLATFRWLTDGYIGGKNYDIVHSSGVNTNWADIYTVQTVQPQKILAIADERNVAPVSWLRKICWKTYDRYLVRAERMAYNANANSKPRFFLPVSQGTKEELLRWYPNANNACSSNIIVIPNGADLVAFSPDNRSLYRDVIRQKFAIRHDDFLLLFTGGDWRRKGLDLILNAMACIPSDKVKLLVAGHDRAGHEIPRMARELGLASRVVFAGFQVDVNRFYAAADLFVLPTLYEAFSLASIEAAASGLPVLMSDVSGARELIVDSQAGELIARDPIKTAQAICKFVDSPALLSKAGHSARLAAEKYFNWDSVTEKTLTVYEQCLRARRLSPRRSDW